MAALIHDVSLTFTTTKERMCAKEPTMNTTIKAIASHLSVLSICLLAACGSDDEPIDDVEASATIVTVGGDYAGAGVLSVVSVPSMDVTVNAVAGVVGGDPAIRQIGDRLFILDRFGGDSVTVLDRDLSVIGQVSTGAGSNPQDVAVIGDTLYVAAWDAGGVLVIDLADIAGGIVREIDLSDLDSEDQVPDCNSLAAVGSKLLVTCQIIDRSTFAPRGNGKLAVIDTSDDSIETTLDLDASNPFAQLESLPSGDVAFSTAPGALFGGSNDTGCLERVSMTGTPSMMPCLSSNMDLAAYPADVLAVGESIYFVNVASFTESDIRVFTDGSVAEAGLAPLGSNLAGLAACPTGHLVVADNSDGARGLRVFDAELAPASEDVLDVGWPAAFAPNNATICW